MQYGRTNKMIRETWDSVMNAEKNPLRNLPKIVQFQVMTYLSIMWSILFSLWTGWMILIGPSILAHVLILMVLFFTFKMFKDGNIVTHRDLYKDKDGGVRYDDIWGG